MDWLEKNLDTKQVIPLSVVLLRLLISFLCGYLISVTYRFTRPKEDVSPTFIPTLVLLTILIALVSQVIGESTARAFTLVGTLSIVRFRTVVRDTQDTAFVIFAVVVGMAVGTGHFSITILGMVVVAAAAFLVQPRRKAAVWEWADTVLTVKIGSSQHPETLLVPVLKKHVDHFDVSSVSTARQGIALELNYKIRLKSKSSEADLVKELNGLDGVQSVDVRRIELEG